MRRQATRTIKRRRGAWVAFTDGTYDAKDLACMPFTVAILDSRQPGRRTVSRDRLRRACPQDPRCIERMQ